MIGPKFRLNEYGVNILVLYHVPCAANTPLKKVLDWIILNTTHGKNICTVVFYTMSYNRNTGCQLGTSI